MKRQLGLALTRIFAFALDYLVIALYMSALFALAQAFGVAEHFPTSPWLGQLAGFVSLTLPVLLYFASFEASRFGGTPGKRVMGLTVVSQSAGQASLVQTTSRAAIKFLPWELSHFAIHRVDGWPSNPEPLGALHIVVFGLAGALSLWYVVSLFLGRAPYDSVVKTKVVASQRWSRSDLRQHGLDVRSSR